MASRPWRGSVQDLLHQSFSKVGNKIAAQINEWAEIQKLDARFSVPVEPFPTEIRSPLRWDLNEANWSKRLNIFDPEQSFRRYFVKTPSVLRVYQDRDHRRVLDFEVVKQTPPPLTSKDPRQPDFPLRGLRIAIDPGHIGSPLWDRRDGKYVQDRRGRMLSEGTMALQTALMLEQELQLLGAEVLLTRRGFQPVFQGGAYETFPLRGFAEDEFRASRLSDWFLHLLNGTSSAGLFSAMGGHANVRRIFQDGIWARYRYFFSRADLQARADVINRFQPDYTMIIHFDIDASASGGHGLNPQNYNSTKAFVPGHFEFAEVGTRAERAQLVRGLVQSASWEGSVKFSRAITHSISARLGIPLDRSHPAFVTPIEPGVFARNLGLLRRLEVTSPVTFLECLFYNGPTEFEKLVAKDHTMMVDGVRTSYSTRLKSLVEAIRDGLLAYQP